MNVPTLRNDPARMTGRARAYLTAAACKDTFIAFTILSQPEEFNIQSWQSLHAVMPLTVWGIVMGLAAIILWTAVVKAKERIALYALVVSAIVCGVWAGGWAVVAYRGDAPPVLAVAFAAFAVKDLIQAGSPMRSPFHRMVDQYEDR